MKNEYGFVQLLEHREYDAELGGLIGLLIGDALGVPFEFHSPGSLPPRHLIEIHPPKGYPRSHAGVPIGTWSDDGAQMLCLVASLLEHGRFLLTDFSEKLVKWLYNGYMAVDGDVFDVGIQTQDALAKLRYGASPHESGGRSEMKNGNGSIMRVLPLAILHSGADEKLIRDAHLSSLPTHAHPRSMVACAFYCLLARGYLTKLDDAWSWADRRLQEVYEGWPNPNEGKAFLIEFNVLRDFPKTNEPRGSGYVIDTIWSARRALEEKSFEDTVRSAILLGNDTDTTAAVTGGIAGLKFGFQGLSQRWLEKLRGFELIEPMIPGFLAKVKANRTTTALQP